MPNEWEVWWATVAFEDYDGSKVRPVIVFENREAYILSLKVTSHPPRRNYQGEFELLRWIRGSLNCSLESTTSINGI